MKFIILGAFRNKHFGGGGGGVLKKRNQKTNEREVLKFSKKLTH